MPIKRNLGKIRRFVKELGEDYHSAELADHPGCTYLFGGGELHVYCSNYHAHSSYDYRRGYAGFAEWHGRWEGEAMDYLRSRGWVFSTKHDVCVCPKCAKENGLLEFIRAG